MMVDVTLTITTSQIRKGGGSRNDSLHVNSYSKHQQGDDSSHGYHSTVATTTDRDNPIRTTTILINSPETSPVPEPQNQSMSVVEPTPDSSNKTAAGRHVLGGK